MSEDRCIFCMEINEEKSRICPHCGRGIWQYRWQKGWYKPLTVLKNRYILGVVLGQGAFGVIYLAWDKEMCRKVAVKVFSADENLSAFEREREMFHICEKIPGLVKVYDSFVEEEKGFLVMEYLPGGTLKQHLAQKPEKKLSPEKALKVLEPILRTLVYLHSEGIIHCDISADNIMLDETGNSRLIDLGAAQMAGNIQEERLLKEAYGAPEQYANPEKIGPWTDVYESCALLYEIITGERISPAASRIRKDSLQSPSIYEKIPQNVENAIMRGLELEIQKRYFSVTMLMNQLGMFMEQVKVLDGAVRHFWGQAWISISAQGKFTGNVSQKRFNLRRFRKAAAAAVIVLSSAVAGIGGYCWYFHENPQKYFEKKLASARADVKNHQDEQPVICVQENYEEIVEYLKEHGTQEKSYISDSEGYQMTEEDVCKLGIPVNGKYKLYLDWKTLRDAFFFYMGVEEKEIDSETRYFSGNYMRYTTNLQELYNYSSVKMEYSFTDSMKEDRKSEQLEITSDPLDERGISVRFSTNDRERVTEMLTEFLPVCCPETYLTEAEVAEILNDMEKEDNYLSLGLSQRAWIYIYAADFSDEINYTVTIAADDGGLI